MPSRPEPRRYDHARPLPGAAAARAGSVGPRRAPRRGLGRPSARALRIGATAVTLVLAVGLLGRLAPASAPADPAAAAEDLTGPDEGDALPQLATSAPTAAPTPVAPAGLVLPTGYSWPLPHSRITSAFGYRRGSSYSNAAGLPVHDGIDLATYCGDHVLAAHDGVVLAAGRHYDAYMGWLGDLGPATARRDALGLWGGLAIGVIVDDGNGWRSVYLHFSRVVVKAGQHVKAGDMLGYEGQTGHATGCHLHYSLFPVDGTETFRLAAAVVAKSLLPDREIARIDPLLVLPPLSAGKVTWGWGAITTPPPG